MSSQTDNRRPEANADTHSQPQPARVRNAVRSLPLPNKSHREPTRSGENELRNGAANAARSRGAETLQALAGSLIRARNETERVRESTRTRSLARGSARRRAGADRTPRARNIGNIAKKQQGTGETNERGEQRERSGLESGDLLQVVRGPGKGRRRKGGPFGLHENASRAGSDQKQICSEKARVELSPVTGRRKCPHRLTRRAISASVSDTLVATCYRLVGGHQHTPHRVKVYTQRKKQNS